MYAIPTATLFVGKNCLYLPECPSTNQYAMQLLSQQALPEGTLVITDRQTAGRGQMGSVWQAAPQQNITASVVLKPTFLPLRQQFYLNMAFSLAVYDTLAVLQIPQIAIKWANDVLIQEKKVAGILIENLLKGQLIQHSIVGIGLNINQTDFEGLPQATSLKRCTGQTFPIQTVLHELLVQLEKRYLQLKHNPPRIKQDYLTVLYKYQSSHTFYLPDQTPLPGRIVGIDEVGRLGIELTHTQQIHYFNLKEICFFA